MGIITGRYPAKETTTNLLWWFWHAGRGQRCSTYAKDRLLMWIPEIEMPATVAALLSAYPWVELFPEQPHGYPFQYDLAKASKNKRTAHQTGAGNLGRIDDVFCAGKDSTFMFLQNVIDEVILLSPSRYFHIGGDECPKTH